jgi:hypothetical protein
VVVHLPSCGRRVQSGTFHGIRHLIGAGHCHHLKYAIQRRDVLGRAASLSGFLLPRANERAKKQSSATIQRVRPSEVCP